jgi:threonine dehydratase
MSESIDRAAITQTYRTIRERVRRTPVLDLDGVTLKLEQLQHSGSFKARGAIANLLLRDVPAAGVVAASGGNHGAAVAWAAREQGVLATIFVPTISAPAKLERIRGYGATLVVTGDRYAEALAASRVWSTDHDALVIHAYDQPFTLLG